MLAIERRNQIMECLQRDKRVVVSELSRHFEVSEETIRRDLEKLEKEGYVTKSYGGAILNENDSIDFPFNERKLHNVVGKQCIAEMVAGMINDGDHLIMDGSSTAVYVSKYIRNKKNITLITNSIEILVELVDVEGWEIMSTGGILQPRALALVGPESNRMIESYHADKAVVSSKGLDLGDQFTDSDSMHAETKRKMLEHASRGILAVDYTKFGRIAFARIGKISDVSLIVTDREPDAAWREFFEKNEIQCLFPRK